MRFPISACCLIAVCLLPRLACAQVIFSENEPVSGASLSTLTPHSGQSCLQWQHGKSASLRFTQVPPDWTPYDTLTLWLRTDTAGGASFYLIIPSETPQTEGDDYYSAHLTVMPGGWQQFSLYLTEELSRNRQPVGFDKIGGMLFTASGWGQTLNPEAVVQVDDVRLEKRGPLQGPRLTDPDFFAALDLPLPALSAVKAAADQQDWPAARAEYVKYLRSLPHPWKFDWRSASK